MAFKFLNQRRMRARRARLADRDGLRRSEQGDAARIGDQAEADLPPAGQLDIDLGKQLRVEQRAVLDAVAAVDAEAHAQRIEAVLGAGVPGAGERQRVDHAVHADRRAAATFELVIEEAEVEAGIVRDERRILDELEQLLGLLGEARLVGQEQVDSPCTASASNGMSRSGLK